MPEISIKAETITSLFGFHLTNSLLLSFVGVILIFVMGIAYRSQITASQKSGFFYIFNVVLKNIYILFKSVLNNDIAFFFPLLGAFFLWVMIQNWLGLLPGVGSLLVAVKEGEHTLHVPLFRSNNADLNATLVLALVSVVLTQIFGIKFVGFRSYIKKFIDISNPINFFVGILEFVSEISKIISFAFRLFGNIFAGEVLMTIIAFLVPVIAPFPFLLLEVFVGFIQALVFSMLSAVFLSMAITKHH
ncbi:hypothetical protein A2334_02830 [Candidatus Roizmanbacteria bacterium RIFOXYB2_FULL_38_10]|uniref:ATP synthase subunit a n=1 Tax=Candidatus Roizmanbacteria bacterium RIFOXYD1_FULL_38_12 TaxID=1802093 RepID=A0A1F7L0I3_9BACT|nr:MAG: hypothetical protein A3K47_02170 [Candidatus Roizmanbacteria bacterium RIFOXYA2_FULL_38_14]OGK63583.1 MAG: hypothetical protein A3K27_02170 [Candidatus Roizmanbacteria bacterium RIFOXYA1_FULL_37_12]OGK65429.1 MAG: hypothetical protein A3K38_02170 [Candidatus Roizmanbacteria bacterium RIFOXYB1_FULL_40_23]OGK69094.1 MAG: hypothetical protein A2334_02830 [Candidatus Roizmanbacteria bacterium RIFOXYB2_FULL_38_10]OGK69834.1 MAG: hypothetical protein A3K21_02175 [Candidatus Roizmanbacteria ba